MASAGDHQPGLLSLQYGGQNGMVEGAPGGAMESLISGSGSVGPMFYLEKCHRFLIGGKELVSITVSTLNSH